MPHARLIAVGLPVLWFLSPATTGADLSFTDVTTQAGLDTSHAYDPGGGSSGREMGGGGAIADFNNDGWQDIFFLSGGLEHDKLFINNTDGTFSEEAADWGLHTLPRHIGSGAVAGDINDDGYIDLYITSLGDAGTPGQTGKHRLYLNTGPDADGRFHFRESAAVCGVETTATDTPDGFGAALGDPDLDGDLDLAVAGWVPGGHNILFRNDGPAGGFLPVFTDATDTIDSPFATPAGLDLRGFSPRFIDMDGDWRPEILWISDFVTSRYLRNNPDNTFTDITEQTGTGLDQNGMGTTQGDFNNDGLIDFYVSAIDQPDYKGKPREGNRLYINQGAHNFVETAQAAGVSHGLWGWGVTAADFDNDGDLDIAETNGWDHAPQFFRQACRLFINRGDATFQEGAERFGMDFTSEGRGLNRIDYDNDGDQDIVIFSKEDRFTLLRNNLTGDNTNWLRVFINTRDRPDLAPRGIGARVTIKTSQGSQVRLLDAGPSFLACDERSAHFGTADADSVFQLNVEFHDGTLIRLENVPANQTLQIATPPCRVDYAPPFGVLDLADIQAFIAYFVQGHRTADLAEPTGTFDLADLQTFSSMFAGDCP